MTLVTVDIFDDDSIENAVRQIQQFELRTREIVAQIVRRLADDGVEIANVYYDDAIYAGYNDADVRSYVANDGQSARIVANGVSVLFIEFGTGITKASDPVAETDLITGGIVPHGTWGDGRGSQLNGWIYVGDVGQNPPEDTHMYRDSTTKVLTKGNDANSVMWRTREALGDRLVEIYEEVMRNYDR